MFIRDDKGPYKTVVDQTDYWETKGFIWSPQGQWDTIEDHTRPWGGLRVRRGPYKTMVNHIGPQDTTKDYKGFIYSVEEFRILD